MGKVTLLGGSNSGNSVDVGEGQTSLVVKKLQSGFQKVVSDLGEEKYHLQEITDSGGGRDTFFVVEGGSAARLLAAFFRDSNSHR